MYNNAEVVRDNPDPMKVVVKCPYCGEIVEVGELIGISGLHGCPNCYWSEYGLKEVVMYLQNNDYNTYVARKFYKDGYIANIKKYGKLIKDFKDRESC